MLEPGLRVRTDTWELAPVNRTVQPDCEAIDVYSVTVPSLVSRTDGKRAFGPHFTFAAMKYSNGGGGRVEVVVGEDVVVEVLVH